MNLFPQAFKEKRGMAVPASPSSTGFLPPIHKPSPPSTNTGSSGGNVSGRGNTNNGHNNSSGGGKRGANNANTTTTTTDVDIGSYAPDPQRKVYLTTFDRKNPMRRMVREIHRSEGRSGDGGGGPGGTMSTRSGGGRGARGAAGGGGQGGVNGAGTTEQVREEIYSLGSHTDEFIDFLKKLPKQSATAVALVRQRMQAEGIRMNTEVYNLLMDNVCDMYGDNCYTIYNEMRRTATPPFLQPNVQTYRILFRACERNSHFESAFGYYSHMRAVPGLRPDITMYNTLIGYCSLLGDESQAAFLVEEVKELGLEPDVHTYNSLLNAFADAPYEVLLKTYEDMLKRKISPNRRTYNSLMLACQRTGDYERAFQLFEELKRDGLTPDVATYNTLFVMCRDRLDFVLGVGAHSTLRRNREQKDVGMKAVAELAMALLVEMEECNILPNTFTYNALLGVLGRCHDIRTFDLFEQMKLDNRSTMAPNVTDDLMLTWLSTATASGGGASLPRLLPPVHTEEAVDEVLEGWVAGKGVSPNLDTYSTMIDAAKRQGMLERALMYYSELKARASAAAAAAASASGGGGGGPSSSHHQQSRAAQGSHNQSAHSGWHGGGNSSMMTSHHNDNNASSGQQDPSLNATVAAAAALRPTKAIYQLVLEVCALKQDKPKGFAVFAEARQFGIQIDVELINALLNVIAECSDPSILDELEDLKRDKEDINVRPNIDSYNVVLKGCVKLGNLQGAMKLFNELCDPQCPLAGPDAVTYATLFDLCTLNRDIATATELFASIKKRGISAPARTYCRYLNVFVTAGDVGAVTVFEDMKRYGPQPNLTAYSMLLTFYLQRKDNAILALFDEMKSKAGLEPDIHVFNVVLDYAGMKQDHNRALRYFEELKTRGLSPDVETFNALIKCFAPSGSSMVHKIFEEMADSKVAPDHVTFSILMQHKAGCSSLAAALEQQLVYVKPRSVLEESGGGGGNAMFEGGGSYRRH